MSSLCTLAILSDIHYAGAAERARRSFYLRAISNPARRLAIRLYRHYFWQRDPFAHNHLLDEFLTTAGRSDYVVANGDYSCDSAFIGVSDDAACQSARECLDKLRRKFPTNFHAVIGDHELGKKPLGADVGGMRLASFQRAQKELSLPPFWQVSIGDYLLLGLVSSLVALPVYEEDALLSERPEWRQFRALHLEELGRAFDALQPGQRVLLFCHDPTALPFLLREEAVRRKVGQIERTIIGHLHSRLILWKSRVLSGMPVVSFLGHTPRRLSSALRQARHWKPFQLLLCPSLAGIELLSDGGYYTVELDPAARGPARFQLHRFNSRRLARTDDPDPDHQAGG